MKTSDQVSKFDFASWFYIEVVAAIFKRITFQMIGWLVLFCCEHNIKYQELDRSKTSGKDSVNVLQKN